MEYTIIEYSMRLMDTFELSPQRRRICLEYDSAIGSAIADIRMDQGLDQALVAESFGCKQPLISKLEKGQRALKVSELNLLANALGISRDALVEKLLEGIDATELRR